MNKDDKVESHPSYGQAAFHRVTGGIGKLYGSPLAEHHSVIQLTICRSETEHRHGQDWRHGRDQLIEVTFSPAQFAELLTNMNVAEGAPCTINFIQGQGAVEAPPADQEAEHERVVEGFERDVAGTAQKLRENLIDLQNLLEKKTLNKEDKGKIYWMVEKALQDVESNAPFMMKQFGEATEKLVTSARAEVAASTIAIVQKLGFEKLEDMRTALGAAPSEGLALPAAKASTKPKFVGVGQRWRETPYSAPYVVTRRCHDGWRVRWDDHDGESIGAFTERQILCDEYLGMSDGAPALTGPGMKEGR